MAYENGRSRSIDLDNMELDPIRRTRFHVNRVDSLEGRASLLGEQETKKSLRNLTREALPRLENYRNILSLQAVHRPTLDELHNSSFVNKGHTSNTLPLSVEKPLEAGIKFGWIQGVLIRCLLNIWGVMLFLRLSWVVAQAGIGEALLIIITTTVVTTITSLSMSAISTNGLIKGGGTYYMISRSLGPEFGGSIGLIFSLANAIAVAMYVVGFCESLVDCLKSYGICIVDCDSTDVRIIGCITIVLLLMIVVIGMEWEAKAQLGLLVILLVAIADFTIGTFIGPKDEGEKAKGFVGYRAELLRENFYPDYRYSEGVDHNFFSVLAIFFPAATGILAGANISGDLKDPQSAIPKGTLLSILVTTVTYLLMIVMVGASVLRDASGNVTDLISSVTESPILNSSVTETIIVFQNASTIENETSTIVENMTNPIKNAVDRSWSIYGTSFNCTGGCAYGSHNSFQVIELVSFFGPLIYAGCFAASLSSALASLVSAPKVFQALCLDELYPGIAWFSGQPGKEPVRGYILTFAVAVGFILIGELNTIAPLISNFFLAAYTLVNFSTFHASLAKPIGWRPTFKYYNMWLSLAGAVLCVAVMFLISWWTALITLSVVLALYLVVSYRKPDVNWGSTTQAQTYSSALTAVQQLDRVEEHVKNYRPQVLVLSGPPSARSVLVDFAHLVTKNHSLLICGHIVESILPHRTRASLISKSISWLRANKVKGFYSMIDGTTFQEGATAMLQVSGLGKLKPNILLMGYKQDWAACSHEELNMYFNVMHKALDIHVAVALLRVNDGLDYSSMMCDAEQQSTSPRKISSTSMSQNRSFSQLSQASSASDISMPGSPAPRRSHVVSEYPNPTTEDRIEPRQNVEVISKEVLTSVTRFQRKQKKGTIDVWWLYDDGGLTLLMPYIISTRSNWASCKLRVFALANRHSELEYEQRSMASLLAKFRIDYSALTVIPDITKPAQSTTTNFFNLLIADFQQPENPKDPDTVPLKDSELLAMKEKTNRHLRLREILLENSMEANLIVMTLPMPRKGAVSAPLYMAWLETLTRDMPPFLLVRGNHTSVLTFYS
ncbi:bumetanide-sensitive sodium-(potassium)-chloride cotransporter [Neodiprion virginianus]|uniref:bumetanide-sensitive sodium-(potassium)-chloride cotransporter n=1 Tax=Neodiprion virginianus TaxID=2961670 RepID=UPI001EE6F47C|nr:bumetanide-sensitive sodium-(potassium)-chloride cotransporter [Neodiprion virginianus]XP_046626479.1 bumetanide-sensitive sodium-(potassium)-chloride cotransporter [Neodiprion virginianus]XP_046626480.1 bumetanide-sensitive sodium-(potassium)-chloride cotransporter [Neodiprion virginianus]XP_046626481.1 bumetanide-sensitive sodium-(potassium)-chloride cotransporter [Neodiprion virginianus]XP_046626482.1 bumetanide-sensitive sodium-(potassium)-chloride cotransporter [Neodiprion virginianus]